MMSYTVISASYVYWTAGKFGTDLRREIDQGEVTFTDDNLYTVEYSINRMISAKLLAFGMMIGVSFLIL